MASVTVEMPAVLTNEEILRAAIRDGAIVGMQDELEVIVTEIKTSPGMPKNTGTLMQSMTAVPPVVSGETVTGAIISGGASSQYAAVMDLGRRPGRRPPPMAAIKLWVKRKMPDAVNELAAELQSAYAVAHPRARAKVSRAIGKYKERALFLLAAAISRSIGLHGTAARKFVDGKQPEISRRVHASVMREIGANLARVRVAG